MRILTSITLVVATASLSWGQHTEGLPSPDQGGLVLPSAESPQSVEAQPEHVVFADYVTQALDLDRQALQVNQLTQSELEAMEGLEPKPGRVRSIGHQVKLEFTGLTVVSVRTGTAGHAFRYGAAVMAARHEAWGTLDGDPLPAHADTWGGELVSVRGHEVLLAWGPALSEPGRLEQVRGVAWTKAARKSPCAAEAIFHRDYAAAVLNKPHGYVYEQMGAAIERARAIQDPPGVTWLEPGRRLEFRFESGYQGWVDWQEGGGSYWASRSTDAGATQAQHALAVLGEAPALSRRVSGFADALADNGPSPTSGD